MQMRDNSQIQTCRANPYQLPVMMTSNVATRIFLFLVYTVAASNALSLEEHLALVTNTTQNLRTQLHEISPLVTPSYVRLSMYSDDMCTNTKMSRASTGQLNTCIATESSSFQFILESSTRYAIYFYTDRSCIDGERLGSVPIVADCVYNTVFGAYMTMEITSTPNIVSSNEGIFYR